MVAVVPENIPLLLAELFSEDALPVFEREVVGLVGP
jgi:hypothetical protein